MRFAILTINALALRCTLDTPLKAFTVTLLALALFASAALKFLVLCKASDWIDLSPFLRQLSLAPEDGNDPLALGVAWHIDTAAAVAVRAAVLVLLKALAIKLEAP